MDKNLNKEEKELLESYNNGEWEKIPNHVKVLNKLRALAQNFIKKRQTR